MALWLSLLLAAATAVTAADSTTSSDEDVHSGCVHMQIVHSSNTNVFSKRAVELSLANRSDVAYYAKLNFGTPPQSQFVQLDTGSFELWVNPTCTGLSTSDTAFCNAVGHFNTSASSSFNSLGVSKQLRYGIGSANITYAKDSITLPGTTTVLSSVQFGVASTTTDEFSGILGIGFGEGLTTRYPNFIDELYNQNVTRVKAFSLALGSKSEQEGVIVFGGVDTSKFAGQLAKLPITPARFSSDGVARYWVNMSSMALTTPTAAKAYANSSLQVFLDSGSTLTLLPADLAASIAADFGAAAPDDNGYYFVDCSYASANGTLDFAFDGTTIRVPFSELIRRSGSQCMLGIQANSNFVLLGDTFMRSAYVVIDHTESNVWMTQYVNCGSSPAALATAASLPTLTGLCSAQSSGSVNGATSSTSTSPSSTTTKSSATASTTATRVSSPQASSSSSSSPSSSASGAASTGTSSSAEKASSASLAGGQRSTAAHLLAAAVVFGSLFFQLL